MAELIKVISNSGDIVGPAAAAVFVLVWAAGNGAQTLADAIKLVTLSLFTLAVISFIAVGASSLFEVPQKGYERLGTMLERDQRLVAGAKKAAEDGSISGWEYLRLCSEYERHELAKVEVLAKLGLQRAIDEPAAKTRKSKHQVRQPAPGTAPPSAPASAAEPASR